jgi:hypothetical protein
MSTILYRPDGEDLTLHQTLQHIADEILGNNLPDKLFIYGNFNKTRTSLISAIELIDFNLSGLEDALGLLVANAIPSLESEDELKKLFTAYHKHPAPSPAIRQRLAIRVTQWAREHLVNYDDLAIYYNFEQL